MRGRFSSLALIGLTLGSAQAQADESPALRDTSFSLRQPDTSAVPAATALQVSVVTSAALARQAAFTERSGKSPAPQSVAEAAAAAEEEHKNPRLDLILMLCLTMGSLAYPLIRRQAVLRRSSKLA